LKFQAIQQLSSLTGWNFSLENLTYGKAVPP
jgi:hypothetical protein